MMDRFACYELCVQGVRWVVPFLRAVHGADPRVLLEDFCGTGALSRAWAADLAQRGVDGRGVAVDLDPETLGRARREAQAAGVDRAIEFVCSDCVDRPVGARDGCDVVFVGNFSIGYIHERSRLVEYLRRSRERLAVGGGRGVGGVMVVDAYDGPGKFALGSITRTHVSHGREIVRYTWEHRDADALTAMVTNAIHFDVELDGEVVERLPDAFVYRWRLWSIADLREAMREAGFSETNVYQEIGEHPEPLEHGREMKESGIVCVVGRA
jgi:tRNA/tmRNA/rRNA uracil-C5-methylase (TrmA/RlmC/RlmD family)